MAKRFKNRALHQYGNAKPKLFAGGEGINPGVYQLGAQGIGLAGDFTDEYLDPTPDDIDATNYVTSGLSGAAKGVASGAAFGPAGMVVGGAIGLGTSLLGTRQEDKAQEEALRQKQEGVIRNQNAAFQSNLDIGYKNPNYMAYGGDIPINQYDGFDHENGGVDIGPAEVEDGETSIDNYVFSDRIKVPDKKITFAQASKRIQSKYNKRPEDDVSHSSKMRELETLREQQENIRSTMQDDLNGQFASGEFNEKKQTGGPIKPISYLASDTTSLSPEDEYKAQQEYKQILNSGWNVLAPEYEKKGNIPYKDAVKLLAKSKDPNAANYFDAYNKYNELTGQQYDATGTTETGDPIFGERHYGLRPAPQVKIQGGNRIETQVGIYAYGGNMNKKKLHHGGPHNDPSFNLSGYLGLDQPIDPGTLDARTQVSNPGFFASDALSSGVGSGITTPMDQARMNAFSQSQPATQRFTGRTGNIPVYTTGSRGTGTYRRVPNETSGDYFPRIEPRGIEGLSAGIEDLESIPSADTTASLAGQEDDRKFDYRDYLDEGAAALGVGSAIGDYISAKEDPLSFGRVSPKYINLDAYRQETRRRTGLRKNQAMASAKAFGRGAGLSRRAAEEAGIETVAGDQLSKSYTTEETTNAQIYNRAQEINSAIEQKEGVLNYQDKRRVEQLKKDAKDAGLGYVFDYADRVLQEKQYEETLPWLETAEYVATEHGPGYSPANAPNLQYIRGKNLYLIDDEKVTKQVWEKERKRLQTSVKGSTTVQIKKQ